MSAVLVTGATGFLGYHVLAALHAARIPAHALVRDVAGGRASGRPTSAT